MVKYSIRHYAHFVCYLDAGKQLSDLHGWQIKQFPYQLLKERDRLKEAEALIAESDKQDARFAMRNRGPLAP